MILKYSRFVPKYLISQKSELSFSLLCLILLLSLINSSSLMITAIEYTEYDKVIDEYPASLAITNVKGFDLGSWEDIFSLLDDRIESIYPIMLFQSYYLHQPGGATVLSTYYNWTTGIPNLDYNWITGEGFDYKAEHYAVPSIVLQEFLLDSGIFTLVGNATLDENTVLVSEGTMLRHGLEVGGNITLYQNIKARNTTSGETFDTNATLDLKVGGYLKIAKIDPFNDIFAHSFGINNDEKDFTGERSGRIRDFIFYDYSLSIPTIARLFNVSLPGIVSDYSSPSYYDWENTVIINYFLQLADVHSLLGSLKPEDFVQEMTFIGENMVNNIGTSGQPHMSTFNLYRRTYLASQQINSLIRIIATALAIPTVVIGIYFLKTTVSLKQDFRRDLVALLKRKGVSSKQIAYLVVIEEILLGFTAGLLSAPIGTVLARAGLNFAFQEQILNFSLSFSFIFGSIVLGLSVSSFTAFFSHRSILPITPLYERNSSESPITDSLDNFDRLDQLILITGILPFALLIIKLVGFGSFLPGFLAFVIDISFNFSSTLLIVVSPFLLSYSLVRLILIKTSLFTNTILQISKVFSLPLHFLIKASILASKPQTIRILFITCFAISMAIFPVNFIETAKSTAYAQVQQDIGSDIAIEGPYNRINSHSETNLSRYDFVNETTTIMRIKWISKDISYHIYGIDPNTYLDTVVKKNIGKSHEDIIKDLKVNDAIYQAILLKRIYAPENVNTTFSFNQMRERGYNLPDLTFNNIGTFNSLPGILPKYEEIFDSTEEVYSSSVNIIVFLVCNRAYLMSQLDDTALNSAVISFKTMIKLKPGYSDNNSINTIVQSLKADLDLDNIRYADKDEQVLARQMSSLFGGIFDLFSVSKDKINYFFINIFMIMKLSNAYLLLVSTVGVGVVFLQHSWKKINIYRLFKSRGIQNSDFFRGIYGELWSQGVTGTIFGFTLGIILGFSFTLATMEIISPFSLFLTVVKNPIILINADQFFFLIYTFLVITIITFIVSIAIMVNRDRLTTPQYLE